MEELDYLDQVRLIAVDHPAGVEVWPNERFASNPPFPKFKVIVSKNARLPAGAWDGNGRNVLPLLAHRDRRYVTDFPQAPYQGFAGMHSLDARPRTVGFADAAAIADGRFHRLFHRELDVRRMAGGHYADLAVRRNAGGSGKWVRVVDDMGFPAGLARTMVADLTGKLPPGTRLIRITTNLKIYWDRIRIDNSSADIAIPKTEDPSCRRRSSISAAIRAWWKAIRRTTIRLTTSATFTKTSVPPAPTRARSEITRGTAMLPRW